MLTAIALYFGIGALYVLLNRAAIREASRKTDMELWLAFFLVATIYPLWGFIHHEEN
jgi:hypothetical protein